MCCFGHLDTNTWRRDGVTAWRLWGGQLWSVGRAWNKQERPQERLMAVYGTSSRNVSFINGKEWGEWRAEPAEPQQEAAGGDPGGFCFLFHSSRLNSCGCRREKESSQHRSRHYKTRVFSVWVLDVLTVSVQEAARPVNTSRDGLCYSVTMETRAPLPVAFTSSCHHLTCDTLSLVSN